MILRPVLQPVLQPVLRGPLDAMGGSLRPPAANMAAWFRKGMGITDTAGAVSAWADQSGNGRHLTQATGAAQPALQGDGTILFDGVGTYLKCAPFVLNQPETVYLRLKQVTWTANRTWFDGDAVNAGLIYEKTASPNVSLFAGADGPQSAGLAVNMWGSVGAVLNGASSVLNVNGTETAGNVGAGNMGGFTLGANGTPVGLFSNIQVAEVVIYSGAHDAAQRAAVIAYLSTL